MHDALSKRTMTGVLRGEGAWTGNVLRRVAHSRRCLDFTRTSRAWRGKGTARRRKVAAGAFQPRNTHLIISVKRAPLPCINSPTRKIRPDTYTHTTVVSSTPTIPT